MNRESERRPNRASGRPKAASDPIAGLTPLTEATFYILISLVEPLHGYGAMKKIEELSGGRVRIGPGTLYGALSNLLEAGLIEPAAAEEDGRRRSYVTTALGRRVIEAEVARLEQLAAHGRMMLSSGGAGD